MAERFVDESIERPLLEAMEHPPEMTTPILALRTKATGRKASFGATFLRRFVLLVKLGFESPCSRLSLWGYGLVVLNMLQAGGLFGLNFLNGPFIQAIADQNIEAVWPIAGIAFAGFLAWSILATIISYQGERLRLEWRRVLTHKLHRLYFRRNIAYWLNGLDKRIDNADQRLTQDIDIFTILSGQLMFGNYTNSISIAGALTSVVVSLVVTLELVDPLPGGVAGAFVVFCIIVVTFLVMPVARATFRMNEADGFFRFHHARLTEFAECVTFYGGQAKERDTAADLFENVYKQSRALYLRTFFLNLFAFVQNNSTQLITMISIAVVILRTSSIHGGEVTATTYQNALAAAGTLLSALLAIPAIYAAFGQLAGITHRVGQMVEALGELHRAERVVDRFLARDSAVPPQALSRLDAAAERYVAASASAAATASSMTTATATTTFRASTSSSSASTATDIESRGASSEGVRPGAIGFRDVTLVSPAKLTLVRHLSFELTPDSTEQGIMIMGRSGGGKSSLLRVLGGLWPTESGFAYRPNDPSQCLFMPQRPYIFPGTLLDQITYPVQIHCASNTPEPTVPMMSGVSLADAREAAAEGEATIASLLTALAREDALAANQSSSASGAGSGNSGNRVRRLNDATYAQEVERAAEVLRSVKLGYLLDRPAGLQCEDSWSDALSGGEQQRLGFARLLFHRPKFAIMDESTSAMDVPLETHVMQLCRTAGVRYVSVGHRLTLLRHHDAVLMLDGHGGSSMMTPEAVLASFHLSEEDLRRAEMMESTSEEAGAEGAERSAGGAAASTSSSSSSSSAEEASSAAESGAGGVPATPLSPSLSSSQSPTSKKAAYASKLSEAKDKRSSVDFSSFAATNPKEESNVRFDGALLRRFARLVRLGFPSLCSKPTWVLMAAVASIVASALVGSYTSVVLGAVSANTITDSFVKDHDSKAFWNSVILAAVIILAFALLSSASIWFGQVVSLYWYRAMVQRAHTLYFRSQVMFAATNLVPGFDNVDQRIATDTRMLSDSISALVFGSLTSTSLISLLFTGIFSLIFAVQYGWIPIVSGLAWVIVAITLNQFLVQPIVKKVYLRNVREGDFRFGHARVREFCESITFFGGQSVERSAADQRFEQLYTAWREQLWTEFPSRSFTTFTSRFASLFTFIMFAVQIKEAGFIPGSAGHGGPDEATPFYATIVAAGLLGQMISSFAGIPLYLTAASELAAFVHRVCQLFEMLEAVAGVYDEFETRHAVQDNADEISALHVAFQTPTGKVLFPDLTFAVQPNDDLLIAGPSGVGKSSLLRVVGGLWPFESGIVSRPMHVGRNGVFFVPQRPYITEGTLREQILYPHLPEEQQVTDAELVQILEALDLTYLLQRGRELEAVAAEQAALDARANKGIFARIFDRSAVPTTNRATPGGSSSSSSSSSKPRTPGGAASTSATAAGGSPTPSADAPLSAALSLTRARSASAASRATPSSGGGAGKAAGGAVGLRRRHGRGEAKEDASDSDEDDPESALENPFFSSMMPGNVGRPRRASSTDVMLFGEMGQAEEKPISAAAVEGAGVVEDLDVRASWADMLSVGEQQRLGFARLLYHRPKFAIMDESTSAMDEPLEEKCMRACQSLGITCISVGHRATMPRYHQRILRLQPGGRYEIRATGSPRLTADSASASASAVAGAATATATATATVAHE